MLIVLVTGSTKPAYQGKTDYYICEPVSQTTQRHNKQKEVNEATIEKEEKNTSLKTTLCKDCTKQLDQSGTTFFIN